MPPVDPPGDSGDRGPSLARPTLARHRSSGGDRGAHPGGSRRLTRALLAFGLLLAVVAAVSVAVVVRRADDGGPSTSGQSSATAPATGAPSSAGSPVLSAGDVSGVEAAARRVLVTWGHPGASYHAWWSALSPLLTPGAEADYARTDPRELPDLRLSGVPSAQPGPSSDTATVFWPTSQGRFGVDLSRTGQGRPWRMVRILFPGQESSF